MPHGDTAADRRPKRARRTLEHALRFLMCKIDRQAMWCLEAVPLRPDKAGFSLQNDQ
jgi:hypothetical protein